MPILARRLKSGEIKLGKKAKNMMSEVEDLSIMSEQEVKKAINEWDKYIENGMKMDMREPNKILEMLKNNRPPCAGFFDSEIDYKLNITWILGKGYDRYNRKGIKPIRNEIENQKMWVLEDLAEETTNKDFADKVYPQCVLHLEEIYQKIDKPFKEFYEENKRRKAQYLALHEKLYLEYRLGKYQKETKAWNEINFRELYREIVSEVEKGGNS